MASVSLGLVGLHIFFCNLCVPSDIPRFVSLLQKKLGALSVQGNMLTKQTNTETNQSNQINQTNQPAS